MDDASASVGRDRRRESGGAARRAPAPGHPALRQRRLHAGLPQSPGERPGAALRSARAARDVARPGGGARARQASAEIPTAAQPPAARSRKEDGADGFVIGSGAKRISHGPIRRRVGDEHGTSARVSNAPAQTLSTGAPTLLPARRLSRLRAHGSAGSNG